ncbi:hypothetical protein HMPREF9413_3462 [Paenibacillus sp. HGF7]|nr:hypothetical protein HMPREF9413_3462 [Paenibacillus sp. HGF7]
MRESQARAAAFRGGRPEPKAGRTGVPRTASARTADFIRHAFNAQMNAARGSRRAMLGVA